MLKLGVPSVQALVPKAQRSMITQEFVDKLNNIQIDGSELEAFKENFVSYLSVLKDGKYKMDDYINAVRFVTSKLLGNSDIDAYIATFPDRYDRLAEEYKEKGLEFKKDCAAPYASMYKKNKLVMAIYEQTIIPSHVLNAPMFQETLETLVTILKNSRSDMARVSAANAILQHTKQPETKNIKLDLGIETGNMIEDLRKATEQLSLAQQNSIQNGISVKEIAESNIIEATIDED